MHKPIIAITMGDAAGIGPELIVKLLGDATIFDRCRPFIIGDVTVLRDQAMLLNADCGFVAINDCAEAQFDPATIAVLRPRGFELGATRYSVVDPQFGKAAALYLETAYDLAQQGLVNGVVAAPMNKEAFHLAGYDYFDELEFLADITNSPEPFILGAVGAVWGVAVTEHIAFKEIVGYIKTPTIQRRIQHLHHVLQRIGYDAPRIAVAALNPHAGEGGLFGREEIDEIEPAIACAVAEGIQAQGPVPADIVFKRAFDGEFDGVVCMYHDQLNIARKLQAREQIATLWMGLPVIGATTAHGTAFDIAGQGIADPGSLAAALDYAIKLAR